MANIKYLIILCVLASCSPKIVTVTEYKERTQTLYERDSIYVRDSIYLNSYIKGDTVFKDKIVYQYRYKDAIKRDSIYLRDSIPYPVEVYKEVNILTWWQSTQIRLFWIILICFLGYFSIKNRSYILRLFSKFL